MVPIDVVEVSFQPSINLWSNKQFKAILQNVTFQEDIDEYATNDTEQFHDYDQEVITR